MERTTKELIEAQQKDIDMLVSLVRAKNKELEELKDPGFSKVYVVVVDMDDGKGSSIMEIDVFDTLDAAKEDLRIIKEKFKNEVTNWADKIFTFEETDKSFAWFETGYYYSHHYCVNIYEQRVMTDAKEAHYFA